jgi:uncharacterized protein (DUF433 family)
MASKQKATSGIPADSRVLPAYTISEAAHYVRMPEATLRSWMAGRSYPVSGQKRVSKPVIQFDDPKRKFLSFINLVEVHVLTAIRRRHGIKLPKVRRALQYVKQEFAIERPLIHESFQTDGLDLFVERYGQLINASREGQQAMKDIISVYLQRIERDTTGLPVRLYPFTRETESDVTLRSDPRLVVMTPDVSFGRPFIAGTGVPVSAIYERYKAGDSVADLAQDFRLETSAVEEAIRCEAA